MTAPRTAVAPHFLVFPRSLRHYCCTVLASEGVADIQGRSRGRRYRPCGGSTASLGTGMPWVPAEDGLVRPMRKTPDEMQRSSAGLASTRFYALWGPVCSGLERDFSCRQRVGRGLLLGRRVMWLRPCSWFRENATGATCSGEVGDWIQGHRGRIQ